ncbi:MAG: hypothetical protein EOO53_14145 [Gammaproteobacteria bacterium]|nr:MAG: hypothetical protein EOO53_14145 [Gammaproteobacteria bacterium]
MIATAQMKVMRSTQWMTHAHIVAMAQIPLSAVIENIKKWRASNDIFSIIYQREELFPLYAFDKKNGYHPFVGLKPVLKMFLEKKDAWGIAYWFASANGYLGGNYPQTVLQIEPEKVLRAAKDELEGISHG